MEAKKKKAEMEEGKGEKSNTVKQGCIILGIDYRDMFYTACGVCQRSLPTDSLLCRHCVSNNKNPPPPPKRLFRILMSIATDTRSIHVICFDRVARALFGCTPDQFFDFAKLHPKSAVTAFQILEAEMFAMNLTEPRNGNGRHPRVTSAVPLSSEFRPVMEVLKQCYRSPQGS